MSLCVFIFFLNIKMSDNEDQQAENAFEIFVSITDKSGNLKKPVCMRMLCMCAFVCVCISICMLVLMCVCLFMRL